MYWHGLQTAWDEDVRLPTKLLKTTQGIPLLCSLPKPCCYEHVLTSSSVSLYMCIIVYIYIHHKDMFVCKKIIYNYEFYSQQSHMFVSFGTASTCFMWSTLTLPVVFFFCSCTKDGGALEWGTSGHWDFGSMESTAVIFGVAIQGLWVRWSCVCVCSLEVVAYPFNKKSRNFGTFDRRCPRSCLIQYIYCIYISYSFTWSFISE